MLEFLLIHFVNDNEGSGGSGSGSGGGEGGGSGSGSGEVEEEGNGRGGLSDVHPDDITQVLRSMGMEDLVMGLEQQNASLMDAE